MPMEEIWIRQDSKKWHTSGWLFAGKASKGGQWYVGHKLGRIHDNDLSRLLWQGGHNNKIEYLLFSTFPSLSGGLEGGASATWVGPCQVESQEEEGVGGPHGSGDPIDVSIIAMWEESYDIQQTPWFRYKNWTVDISRRGLNQYENDNNILCSDLLGNQRGACEP